MKQDRTRQDRAMPNIGKYDQSRLLKAEDLSVGEEYTRVVQVITEEEVGQDTPKAIIPVMWFRGDNHKKGLGLSAKTNRLMLAHNLGSDDTDDWEGRKVVFFRTMTEYHGKPVPCIRFKPKEEIKNTEPLDTVDEPNNVLQGEDDIAF
jgi:hypothetical protein